MEIMISLFVRERTSKVVKLDQIICYDSSSFPRFPEETLTDDLFFAEAKDVSLTILTATDASLFLRLICRVATCCLVMQLLRCVFKLKIISPDFSEWQLRRAKCLEFKRGMQCVPFSNRIHVRQVK